MRESGILMPIFSLPSSYGIGCFSKEAYEFVDKLSAADQKYWQILPLGPTGQGDSPYQSFSTFAGNPYFISLDAFVEEGLLHKRELQNVDFGKKACRIDYGKLYKKRFTILWKAYQRFQERKDPAYNRFIKENNDWLEDYSLFMAIKSKHEGKEWTSWEKPLRMRKPAAIAKAKQELAEEIGFYCFQQYYFWKQWEQLHAYAKKKHVKIIGDIPFYVASDSADVWSCRKLFELDQNAEPVNVAGCPPDSFSPTGQVWGNPLYTWEYHKQTHYRWWIKRISYNLKKYDMLRIDHFRGFDEYYSIPNGDLTAANGHWEKGPGMELFRELQKKVGRGNIIAEDLGFLTDSVRNLVHETGYPGMKIIEFAFDSREKSDNMPYHFEKNCVVYTGTHDNDTLQSWYQKLDRNDKRHALQYMGNQRTPQNEVHMDFIRLAMSSIADLCIIPIQDYLGLGEEARINTPSTNVNNWCWRLKKGQITDNLVMKIQALTSIYGR